MNPFEFHVPVNTFSNLDGIAGLKSQRDCGRSMVILGFDDIAHARQALAAARKVSRFPSEVYPVRGEDFA